jgi:hypothetical protein
VRAAVIRALVYSSGRNLEEIPEVLPRRAVLSLLATCFIIAGCGEKPPPPEDKAVLDAYEAALFMPDPDLNVLIVQAAWLGPESVPPVVKLWPSAATNDKKRVKLARLLEILAWNGFRTPEAVAVLASMAKDRQLLVRKSAINALFASGADFQNMDSYWDPADATPGRTENPVVHFRLPFTNCRELLSQRGISIPKNPDGTIAGGAGRTHEAQPPVPAALKVLRKWFSSESDPSLRLYSAIQALRMGERAAIEPLVTVLRPLPEGSKTNPGLDSARLCAVRALQEHSGEMFTTSEQWDEWWAKSRSKPPGAKPETRTPEPPK